MSYINDRVTLIKKYKNTYDKDKVSFKNICKEVLGNLNNHKFCPIPECIYYQCVDVGTPLNKSLRSKTKLNSLFNRIMLCFDDYFDKCKCLTKNVTLYRGIPENLLEKYNIGDIIQDKAFLSTSISPITSSYFSNYTSMLEIHLGDENSNDKVLCLQGDQFYNDTMECVLSRNLKLQITDIKYWKYDKYKIKIYRVISLGVTNKVKYEIDYKFDKQFINIFNPIHILLKNNDGDCRNNHKFLIYSTKNDERNYIEYIENNPYLPINDIILNLLEIYLLLANDNIQFIFVSSHKEANKYMTAKICDLHVDKKYMIDLSDITQ